MKTTLWNDEEIRRAAPLLARVQEDVTEALESFDQIARKANEAHTAIGAASAAEFRPKWVELVHAEDELAAALTRLGVVVDEARAMNGAIAYDGGGRLQLAGTDCEGRLAWWSPTEADWELL